MKINYGCGEYKIPEYINIDIESSTQPDLVHDLRFAPLPYENNSVEAITCFHAIEHVEKKFWPQFLFEFQRVLIPEGNIAFSYPEFQVCSENFLSNKQGKRDFWRACLYGLQRYPGDYHVVPMDTQEFIMLLDRYGFKDIKSRPEVDEPHNTFLVAVKNGSHQNYRDQEDLIREEVFHK